MVCDHFLSAVLADRQAEAHTGKNQQEYILSCVLEKQIVNTDGIKELIPELKRIGNNLKLISELKQSVELLKNSNELLQDAISGEIGSLKDEVKENTVQEVRKALQANIEAIQRATKLLEKQSDTLTSVMKQKIRELEESKNSFFRYEGLKLYLFWGGMVCNILVFLMLLYGMLGK